jgi:raffinose/stachyose/melibiose transport system substrate-binding protein
MSQIPRPEDAASQGDAAKSISRWRNTMFGLRKGTALAAALVASLAGIAACGSSGSGGSTSSSAKVLKVWWYEAPGSAYYIAWSQAIKDFKKAHPGVKVEFSEKSFNQMQQTAPMVLNSNNVPDVMEYNKGDATTGLLSKQGLLTDLTPQVTKYGWDKLLSPTLQVTSRYDARGVMGSGNWYGVPNYAEYLMVYYNKELFAKYGISVPTTFAEFTAAMDKFVKAHVTPLANAGNDYADVCREHARGLGQEGLHRQGLGRDDGHPDGNRLRGPEVPDAGIRQLVVRPLRE